MIDDKKFVTQKQIKYGRIITTFRHRSNSNVIEDY